jgi:hypothetical protein
MASLRIRDISVDYSQLELDAQRIWQLIKFNKESKDLLILMDKAIIKYTESLVTGILLIFKLEEHIVNEDNDKIITNDIESIISKNFIGVLPYDVFIYSYDYKYVLRGSINNERLYITKTEEPYPSGYILKERGLDLFSKLNNIQVTLKYKNLENKSFKILKDYGFRFNVVDKETVVKINIFN